MPDDEKDAYQEILRRFNTAKKVVMELDDHPYPGSLEEWQAGEYLVFRTAGVDNRLVTVPAGTPAKFRLSFDKGATETYPVRIINKRPPRILTSFPTGQEAKIERNHSRAPTNIKLSIKVIRRRDGILQGEPEGTGIISNLSAGGFALTSAMELHKEDKITFHIDSPKSRAPLVEGQGIVRSISRQGATYRYGIQFDKLEEDARKKIGRIMDELLK